MPAAVRLARGLSWALLVAGLAGLAYAGLAGDLEVHLVLVVPVVSGSGPAAALGGLAAIAGLIGLAWTSLPTRARPGEAPRPGQRASRDRPGGPEASEPGSEAEARGGGVILLGPIPIVWGSDRSALGWLVAAGVVLTLAAVAWTLIARG